MNVLYKDDDAFNQIFTLARDDDGLYMWNDRFDPLSVPLIINEVCKIDLDKNNIILPDDVTFAFIASPVSNADTFLQKRFIKYMKSYDIIQKDIKRLSTLLGRALLANVDNPKYDKPIQQPQPQPSQPPPQPPPPPPDVDDNMPALENDMEYLVDKQLRIKFSESDPSSIPTNTNANEFIWFYDLEVHNGWPARAISQITAVRSDGKEFIDEYVFHAPLHHSYQDVMSMARTVFTLNPPYNNSTPELQPRKLQLSPWDDPSKAKPLQEVMLKWLNLMHDNSICIFMGTTDPGVIMLNLYEQMGLSNTEGILKLMKRKGFLSAKYLDVRKYIYTRFMKKDEKLAPSGGLSKIHNTLFIKTAIKNKMTTADCEPQRYDYSIENWLSAPVMKDKHNKQIKVEFFKRTPVWHTAHTDALVFKNVVAALMYGIYTYKGEYGDAADHMRMTMRYLVTKTRAFTTKLMILPPYAAASLYLFLVCRTFVKINEMIETRIYPCDTKVTSMCPSVILLYKARRAIKASPYSDFKGIDDSMRQAHNLETTTRSGRARAREHNINTTEALATVTERQKRKDQQAAIQQLFKDQFKPNVDLFGFSAALERAELTDVFKTAMTALNFKAKDILDWPIYYLPSTATGNKTSVILHNRACHLLYDINKDVRVDEHFYKRVRKQNQNLLVYVPYDQIFRGYVPVFCKQCKRYANDADPAVPYLIGLMNDIDDDMNTPPDKWDETGWPLSNLDNAISTECDAVAVDIAISRNQEADNDEDSEENRGINTDDDAAAFDFVF
jgi:hypothetical protein